MYLHYSFDHCIFIFRIDVHVRRIGGGFGIKVSRIILSAVACSLVTIKLNLPCRIIHSMEKIMRAFGKRFPCSSDYEVIVFEFLCHTL